MVYDGLYLIPCTMFSLAKLNVELFNEILMLQMLRISFFTSNKTFLILTVFKKFLLRKVKNFKEFEFELEDECWWMLNSCFALKQSTHN